ncbi:YncE family protein [Viridibacillus sp. YIM B01967]|uniref:YncE family protein n=1 Tax=Viridibacillus soli TaxID=2798301 RepID=A0ABS1H970_9BACL|nr:hypothetical protein [Viridibacillus soli]MBK3495969.1 YncE family protein [Viridibacillus soli]
MDLRRLVTIIALFVVLLLSGCGEDAYTAIPGDASFIAAVNIQQPSVTFVNEDSKVFATWQLKKAYTGATLIGQQYLLLYGNQLESAEVYNLSTGEEAYSIATGVGVTNAIYSPNEKMLYIANGKTNRVTAYTDHGEQIAEKKVGNYPMSMLIHEQKLYVVNYKDTKLSVLDAKSLDVMDKWRIPKSSHGMVIVNDRDELWLGGHGEGMKPNTTVDIFNIDKGQKNSELSLPMMPIGFALDDDRIFVVSHGQSQLYEVDYDGKVINKQEIGANPFAVQVFGQYVVVAGYDDQTLYFMKNNKIAHKIKVDKGPFQLIVREMSE